MSVEIRELSFWERLLRIKQEIIVEKGNYNNYGKFTYRSKEDIMVALKPLEVKYYIYVSTDHDIEVVNGKTFIVATAEARDVLDNGVVKFTRTSRAELQPVESVKMNESQLTGSAESYAAKRALEAMFGLDNTKDADDVDLVKEKPRVISSKPKPQGLKEAIMGEDEPVEDDLKNKLHKLGQESLKANSLEDIVRLEAELEKLGGNDVTAKVISGRARAIGLIKNIRTNKWEER